MPDRTKRLDEIEVGDLLWGRRYGKWRVTRVRPQSGGRVELRVENVDLPTMTDTIRGLPTDRHPSAD